VKSRYIGESLKIPEHTKSQKYFQTSPLVIERQGNAHVVEVLQPFLINYFKASLRNTEDVIINN
jgi:hypothetical protein